MAWKSNLEIQTDFDFVVPAWSAGTQGYVDVSGGILRTWVPAIHAGMTDFE